MLNVASRAAATAAVSAPGGILARSFTHHTWISGPPRVRIPFAEKCAHGAAICLGVLFGPAWVLSHMEDYKKRPE